MPAPLAPSHTPALRLSPSARARTVRRAIVAAALCASATPTWAAAQGLQYTQRSKTEMGGPMAAMMSAGGQRTESESRSYVLGSRVRTDNDDQSTIVDMEAGTLVMLHHGERTFVQTTFDELAAEMARVRAQAQEQMGDDADPEAMTLPVPEITRTDERETILGYEARRTIVSVETPMMMRLRAQGMPGMQGGGQGSGMHIVMVNDMWLASDVPGIEMSRETAQQWAEKMSSLLPGGGTMAGVAADGDVGGIPLRSVATMVMVPEGAELDMQAVLEGADEPLGGEGGGLGAMARMMGDGGSGGQMVFSRTVTEVTEIQQGGVEPSIFEVPAGYRETTLAEMMQMMPRSR